jgi:hypothetical protein
MTDKIMGLELYSIWEDHDNPRAKTARWFRYRHNIKHCRPQRDELISILLPAFEEYASDFLRFSEDEYNDPEDALWCAMSEGRGLSNVTRGNISIDLANAVLDYFVDNGHAEILESKLKDALEKIQEHQMKL